VTLPLPAGFVIDLDPGTRQLTHDLVFGGSPTRVLRLTPAGQAAWQELQHGPVASRASGLLARRLTDAGLAHPIPPAPAPDGADSGMAAPGTGTPDATVVIPAFGRPELLDRCLASLGTAYPVLVVDDASDDPEAMAGIASKHGAKLIRRLVNGGPGAARNMALDAVASELVAFIDSDCVASRGWIETLAAHFADPAVAAAAPRITGLAPDTWPGRYTCASGALDLGGRPARVMPNTRVSYVPTAALLVRRSALAACARDGAVFEPALRTGEDVDLIWRLHEAGWRIRYEPAVEVTHREPVSWAGLLARRYRYGTSAAPLAIRHPGAVTHLALQPWPTATVAALLARRPAAAAAAFGGSVLAMHRVLRRADVPRHGTARAMLAATEQTWLGIGRFITQFSAPVLAAAVIIPGGGSKRRRWGRRAAAASLLLGPPLRTWAAGGRELDPASFTLGRIADDVAYGLGVWSGCLKERTIAPVRPVITWRPVRTDPTSSPDSPSTRRAD
jgi:mycofactocin system glycosyltransferase